MRTKQELIREITKCGRDPLYFINTYAKIQHPIRGLLTFKTYPYQDDCVRAFLDHRLNIMLKGRQLGMTTITAAFIAWFIIFNRDKNVLMVSTKGEVAKDTIRMIRTIVRYLPRDIGQICRLTTDNKHSLEFTNGSRVKATTTSADAGRSQAVSLLFVDEVAHIEKMDELWTGIWPTLSTGGRAILASTPNGTANFFYRTYKQAQAYETSFNCRFGTYTNPADPNEVYNDRFMWWVHPEHDAAWFANETAGKSARDIAQEYECNFNTSGDTFLPGSTIQILQLKCSEPLARTFDDRNLWMWREPDRMGIYIIACDVSSGFAADYSAFHVLRVDGLLEQVAEYKGRIPADDLGELLMLVSKEYNNATIACENNSGWSGQTMQRITDAEYPYIYWTGRTQNKHVDIYNSAQIAEALPGYRVTSRNRGEMLAKLEQYIRKSDIVLHSQRLVDEFQQFIVMNGRPQAARSAHDDLIMALAGGIWIREESFMSSYRNADMAKALLGATSKKDQPIAPMGCFNQSYQSQYSANQGPPQQKKQTVLLENGQQIDITKFMITMG